ncbi:hypothetical protein [Streptomyces naphthomycinicus]|uniref:hypothetical protein n=1 Tax=Streptomyces naphthomycinicus TaxID=2872625 RepID=UPI001CEC1D64|nr:hypothetical protein [Streptomyces sp. TML10]
MRRSTAPHELLSRSVRRIPWRVCWWRLRRWRPRLRGMPGTASPTSTPSADSTMRDGPVPDDLYQRYQAAHRAYEAHAASCGGCTRDTPECRDGKEQFLSFAQLQDAYLTRLKQRRAR